jgi:hypothetical protein
MHLGPSHKRDSADEQTKKKQNKHHVEIEGQTRSKGIVHRKHFRDTCCNCGIGERTKLDDANHRCQQQHEKSCEESHLSEQGNTI